MRIAEIYQSVQGEGLLTGTPSVFVRASGCNLRCRFCDTPFASWDPEGSSWDVGRIVAEVEAFEAEHVVLSGGEPMICAELMEVCDRLTHLGRHLTIETAGTFYQPVACDLMSISPKLSNSDPDDTQFGDQWARRHRVRRDQPEVVRRLVAEYAYQLKFVIGTQEDATEVLGYLQRYPELDPHRVWLMPEGIDVARLADVESWLGPFCQAHGVRLCPRRQIEWFGARRGT